MGKEKERNCACAIPTQSLHSEGEEDGAQAGVIGESKFEIEGGEEGECGENRVEAFQT